MTTDELRRTINMEGCEYAVMRPRCRPTDDPVITALYDEARKALDEYERAVNRLREAVEKAKR